MTAIASPIVQVGRPSRWRRSKKTRTAYLFLLPALLVMTIITFYPLVFQVYLSFTNYGLANLKSTSPLPNLIGLSNYQRIRVEHV